MNQAKALTASLATCLSIGLGVFAGCRHTPKSCDESLRPVEPGRRTLALHDVDDWTYMLQGPSGDDLDLNAVTSTAYDLAVVDYSRNGGETGEFGASDIAELRAGGRLALAYLSIGEAEEVRFYYDGLPADLVVARNPAFPDNHFVSFCDSRWREVIIGPDHEAGNSSQSYLDRILRAGFDGVYLDIVDAYRFFSPGCARFCPDECNGPNAAEDMAEFVAAIAEHARVTHGRPDFLVFPQNGAEILFALVDEGEAYLATVSGIGQEEAFYGDPSDTVAMDAALNPRCGDVLPALDRFVAAGHLVLVVDYLTDGDLIDDFYARARRRGYVPYAAPSRDLDRVAVPDGHEPD